jgi:16S rRNA (cytosine1402-N4)-methyltransferase
VAITWQHTTVLLNEAVDALITTPDGHYVDATFGRGGHSRLILSRLSAQGRLIAFDKDLEALEEAATINDNRFAIRHEGFANIGDLPSGSVHGLLMDLGISSPQIDNPARGFSFRGDAPLDMRMDTTRGQSVAQWLETAEEAHIKEVIRDYGEERFAGPIAKAITTRRQERGPVRTTFELASLVASTVKTREQGQNPATRTFQAFRIFINAELQELECALEASLDLLAPGGRLVVISFHSLEDRIVKQFIAKHSREEVDRRSPDWMLRKAPDMKLTALGRTKTSEAEVKANPRSRSAVMRVAQRMQASSGGGAARTTAQVGGKI